MLGGTDPLQRSIVNLRIHITISFLVGAASVFFAAHAISVRASFLCFLHGAIVGMMVKSTYKGFKLLSGYKTLKGIRDDFENGKISRLEAIEKLENLMLEDMK